jgi:hypothetical protein
VHVIVMESVLREELGRTRHSLTFLLAHSPQRDFLRPIAPRC